MNAANFAAMSDPSFNRQFSRGWDGPPGKRTRGPVARAARNQIIEKQQSRRYCGPIPQKSMGDRVIGDLFGLLAAEPVPVATRREAFESAEPHTPRHRAMALGALRLHGPLTADEIAAKISLSILSTRPRISELAKAHAIEPRGERRVNTSGKSATVWRVAR